MFNIRFIFISLAVIAVISITAIFLFFKIKDTDQFFEALSDDQSEEIVSGPSGPSGPDIDNPFRSLTINPKDPNIIIIGTERNGFVKSSDGGKTWERLRQGLIHRSEGYPEIYDIGTSRNDPNVIYAATTGGGPGPLTGSYPSAFGGVYKSSNGGKTWERKNQGIEENGGRTTAVYVDPNNEDYAVIGISGGITTYSFFDVKSGQFFPGGIYLTDDGGGTWERINLAAGDDNNEYMQIRSTDSALYAFGLNFKDSSKNIGFYKSMDNGRSWQSFAEGIQKEHISYFDVSSNGNTICAIVTTHEGGKLLKTVNGGQSWTTHPLNSAGYTVTISPNDPKRILFGKIDGLYLSADGLQTKKKVIQITDMSQHLADVQFAPSSPNIVYAITVGYDLYKSTDAGENFIKIKNLRNEVLNVIP